METKTTENVGYYHAYTYHSLQRLNNFKGAQKNMHGVKKVILFCIMIVVIPASLIILPLYLKHKVFHDIIYSVAESDIMEIRDGVSSIFCERHTLRMNSSFNAFQLNREPEMSDKRKHIRLKKSMTLPDDTLEYWGFYLPKGATVALKVCSRYEGARILVVKGERNLNTCGLLEHNTNKFDAQFAKERGNVVVTFETRAEIVNSANTDITQTDSPGETGDENHGGEDYSFQDDSDEDLDLLKQKNSKENYIKKVKLSAERRRKAEKTEKQTVETNNDLSSTISSPKTDDVNRDINNSNGEERTTTTAHPHRHQKHKDRQTTAEQDAEASLQRKRRDLILDGKVMHGGNAINFTEKESDSVSSFETGLLTCYDGQILLAEGFQPNINCQNINFLETGTFMHTTHQVGENGYYYYIFYSDNDLVSNDIHAVFNILKPSFEYANISESKGCINNTHCSFNISFWSDEVVIIEIPTRDGIEHEDDDITYLISTCHPRMGIYMIFPVAVLFIILGCAFI